jgi:hypothetical protein
VKLFSLKIFCAKDIVTDGEIADTTFDGGNCYDDEVDGRDHENDDNYSSRHSPY